MFVIHGYKEINFGKSCYNEFGILGYNEEEN